MYLVNLKFFEYSKEILSNFLNCYNTTFICITTEKVLLLGDLFRKKSN